ncbi:MAG: tetratricopeptide repeat protein [Acetobacteraceae bacterium]|nr:tetratricopeptide repeat protein [Acetobacteraceae bacterium]
MHPRMERTAYTTKLSRRLDVCLRAATSILLLILGAACLLPTQAQAQDAPAYVGAKACNTCHAAETRLWNGSHHAAAMQEATDVTVLGNFQDQRAEYSGTAAQFHRGGERFLVHTEGPDGSLRDYEAAYTFGVYPLQQYLIGLAGGRYQAFGIAWDSRPKEQGGQHWFHLYPEQNLRAGDRLHWTGIDQTWNYMCADCHSTDLRKNYDLTSNSYDTKWTDVNVSCEACHGPGSRHVALMQSHRSERSDTDRLGLVAWLKAAGKGRWEMNPDTGIARRNEPLVSGELDACAACHSRRKVITQNRVPGAPLLDSYLPAYLEPGLYHADGQIDGEVYEYGSFLQSRMHAAGVTCSNCHDPHSLKLRAENNALCAQCHMPARFDAEAHHHHKPEAAGAQCVNCHMPAKTYMVIDVRRDHSFRVPRPDLSVSMGVPNTCTQCHANQTASWAAAKVAEWFPQGRQNTPHYGSALFAGRTGAAGAEQQLDQLILDQNQPAIARGSALLLLGPYASPASEAAIRTAITDPNPLVRAAVPRVLPPTPPRVVVQAIAPLLRDRVRAVRIETARALAGVDPQALTPEQRSAFSAAYEEIVAAEMVDADRPEAHLNLGLLDTRRHLLGAAEREYRTALRLDANFVPALANLADLYRIRGQDQHGAVLLQKAMTIEPNNADVRHSLGLLLVRQHNYPEALKLLREASELAPDNARYAYVYAVALNSSGASAEALTLLERTHQQHPADRDVLTALVALTRDKGDAAGELGYARELLALSPQDPQLRNLVVELEQGRKR